MKTRTDALTDYDAGDIDALDRSLVAVCAQGQMRAEQIDSMMEDRDWAEVALFASFSAQSDALELRPWENPPCYGDEDGNKPEDVLLRRMLEAGLSRFEPDPAALKARANRKA